ncbi:MAG: type II toxin-antitoxin system HicA family toxin [Patescibacteria group bacterium]
MGNLSSVSAREAVRAFEKVGFTIVSQRGSHIKMRRALISGKTETIIIPNHKHLKEGTLRKGILRAIGMATKEFITLLKK